MFPVFAAACFIGVIVMSNATLRAGPVQASLRVGDRFPVLKGQFLSGREAELPRASSGKVALVAMGFTYKSRFPVEAWADWYRTTIEPTTAVTFFEVPMIGGMVSSTILTLVVIPAIYGVIKGWRVPVTPLHQAQGRCVEEPGVHEQVT